MGTPYVWIERTLCDGRTTREWVPALVAAHEAVHGPQNGLTVVSLRGAVGRCVG